MRREGGFALLIVLWTMVLLALLVAQFTAAGRSEVRVVMNLRANAVAQAAADGALHEAILRLLQGAWTPGKLLREVRSGGTTVEVRVSDQARLINPNAASTKVLEALFGLVGVETGKAATLASAVVDWRSKGPGSLSGGLKVTQYQAARLSYSTPNQPFDSLNELGLVAGMTPALLAQIRPFLSIYQEGDAPVLFDLPVESVPASDDSWQIGSTGRVMIVMIEATTTGTRDGQFTRQAIVRLRAEPSLGQAPYQILTWDTPLK